MGNCCVGSGGAKVRKPNPFSAEEQNKRGGLKVLFTHNNLEGLPIRGGLSVTDKYTLGEELGRGEFGITYLCTDNETQEEFACKSISKKKLRTAIDIEDVRREVTIMHHLASNPNIVSLRDVFEADDAVHIVMELCQGGELFDRIVARGRYNECAAAEIIKTIAEIIQSCHNHGVMHRDLKPENFLFANMKENSPLKAIDFGFSVYFKPGERFSEIVGSPYYMAPEVYKRDYGPEVDIWSAGVILYILLCGVPPFWADTEQGIARAILAGVIDFKRDPFPMVSESAKSMVRQMLEPNPNLRLTAQQVLDHPWIQNAKNAPDVPLGDAVRVRLKQFSTMNKFKKKALRVIVEHLSGEEVKKIKDLFKMMDTNNDGLIDFDGLKLGIQKLGCIQLAESEIQQLMEAADIDGNGMLDYGEFAALTFHLQRFDSDEHLQKAFSSFDLDSDGYISIEELKQVVTDDSSPDSTDLVERIMQEVDIDKDGRISYKEFGHMMRSGMDWRNVSRHYSRQRLKNIRRTLKKDGSLQARNR